MGIFIILVLDFIVGMAVYKKTEDTINNLIITILSSIVYVVYIVYTSIFLSDTYMSYEVIIIFLVSFFSINLFCFMKKYIKGKKLNISGYLKYLCIYFVVAYFILMSNALFFYGRGQMSVREINMIPFRTISQYLSNTIDVGINIVVINILGNIVLFIPIGFVVGILLKKRYMNILVLIILPVLIEVIQYITGTGISDIDDFILNFTGELIGLIVLLGIEKLYRRKHKINIGYMFSIK